MTSATIILALILAAPLCLPLQTAYAWPQQSMGNAETLLAEADALWGTGTVEALQGSAAKYVQALEAFKTAGLRTKDVYILGRLGHLHYGIGEYETAFSHFDNMLKSAQAAGHRTGEVVALTGLGDVKQAQGEFLMAVDYYARALRRSRSDSEEARVRGSVGWTYYILNDYQRALDHLFEAFEAVKADKERVADAVLILNRIGRVHEDIGQHRKAVGFFNQALALTQNGAARFYELSTFVNLARANFAAGDRAAASMWFDRAARKLDPHTTIEDRVSLTLDMGAALQKIGLGPRALKMYRQALTFLDESSRFARHSKFRRMKMKALNSLGQALVDMGETKEGAEPLNQALSLARVLGDGVGEAEILENLGRLAETKGNLDEALTHYSRSAVLREDVWSATNLESLRLGTAGPMAKTYGHIIRVNMRQGKPQDAFGASESSRARTLLEHLGNERPSAYAGLMMMDHMVFGYAPEHVDINLVVQVKELEGEIKSLDEKIRRERTKPDGEAAVRALEERRAEKQREYATSLDRIVSANMKGEALKQVRPLSRAEVQSHLDANTTLLSYYVTNEQTYAFVITRESFEAIQLNIAEEQLRRQVSWFRTFASLTNPKPPTLKNLHDKLIAPLSDRLKTRNLLVVPHGVLNYLPFAALHDGKTFLSEHHEIRYLPSCSMLQFDGRGGQPSNKLLAFSQSKAEGLPDLGYADAEVASIAALFGVKPVMGKSASPWNFMSRARGHEYIHLAAHAVLNSEVPLFSRIVLSPDAGVNRWVRTFSAALYKVITPSLNTSFMLDRTGYLELRAIHSLDLSGTSMVVLSGCETQVGQRAAGDDIVALNRAFLQAGARTVVASLWKVDDEATKTLMTSFYAHLKSGMSKAGALSEAQAETRQLYPHPYYWAAFVLTGDPGESSKVGLRRY